MELRTDIQKRPLLGGFRQRAHHEERRTHHHLASQIMTSNRVVRGLFRTTFVKPHQSPTLFELRAVPTSTRGKERRGSLVPDEVYLSRSNSTERFIASELLELSYGLMFSHVLLLNDPLVIDGEGTVSFLLLLLHRTLVILQFQHLESEH